MTFFKRALLLMAVLLQPFTASAAKISDMFGATVTIQSPTQGTAPGDLFYTVDTEGHHKSIVRITSVRGDIAYGKTVTGKPAVGQSLEKRGAKRSTASIESSSSYKMMTSGPNRWHAEAGLAYFTNPNFPSVSYDTGIAAGAYYSLIDRPVMVDVGALFYQAGSKLTIGSGSYALTGKWTLNYIGFPVLAKWDVYSSGQNTFRAKAGAMPSYLLSSNSTFTQGGVTVSFSGSNAAYTTSSFDLLLVAGLEWVMKPQGYWADLTYNYGLINSISGGSGASALSTTNSGYILGGGMTF